MTYHRASKPGGRQKQAGAGRKERGDGKAGQDKEGMMSPGDVLSYLEMCAEEGVNLQRGMNFRLHSNYSVILMSLRPGAPYADRIEDDGKTLIYEGHDVPKINGVENPKIIDQPMHNLSGSLTENGLFFTAALKYKNQRCNFEIVKVYEKIRSGIWVYSGKFKLLDTWQDIVGNRKVFKFRLELIDEPDHSKQMAPRELNHNRMIPTAIKIEVWKRDKGRCVKCGSTINLHFDHIIPYSKGGSSSSSENIQLLCAKHNILKKDKIE